MDNARVMIDAPKTAKKGEIITLRAMIGHDMETGYRRDANGAMLRRQLIRRFECHFENQLIFAANFHAAIAANPFLSFTLLAQSSGNLVFEWKGDEGFNARLVHSLISI